MAVCKSYLKRLDLLTHGYIKDISEASNTPNEIINMIKIWHSNNEAPKLICNLLTIGDAILECYLDRNHWNILDIDRYAATYIIDNSERNIKGTCDTSKFFEKENLISFITKPDELRGLPWDGNNWVDVRISAKDSKGENIAQSDVITFDLDDLDIPYLIVIDFDKTGIDVNNEGKVSLNEWMMFKNKIENEEDDLLWKRIFYFANFMNKTGRDYEMNSLGLRRVLEKIYISEEFDRVTSSLREMFHQFY